MRSTDRGAWAALLAVCVLFGARAEAAGAERAVIGHSALGRPLTATTLGDPGAPGRVLVIGCVHGDETAGIRVARRLMAVAPPRDAALEIVPSLNPDGVAAGTRGNSRGVDLNRNFPFDWRPLDGLEYSGARPLSEPESRAARRLILQTRPAITIWFHQPLDLVDPARADPAIERRFSSLAGLPLVGLRRYPGSASRWQNHSLPESIAFVVELPRPVSGVLVRRAARAVVILAEEFASGELGPAAEARAGSAS
jgi:murein peptide amidase A